MRLLVFDTATAATVVGAACPGAPLVQRRHDPAPGERPGHGTQLLALVERARREAGLELAQLDRIGVGVGPGSFTGLRIGLATARALSQACGVPAVGVSTPGALALGAARGDEPVLAVLDAGRGEVFVARWEAGREALSPRAARPERLAALATGAALAVGAGAIRFRDRLEAAGVAVPEDSSARHRVGAEALARLAVAAAPTARRELLPEYVRAPDARPRAEQHR